MGARFYFAGSWARFRSLSGTEPTKDSRDASRLMSASPKRNEPTKIFSVFPGQLCLSSRLAIQAVAPEFLHPHANAPAPGNPGRRAFSFSAEPIASVGGIAARSSATADGLLRVQYPRCCAATPPDG